MVLFRGGQGVGQIFAIFAPARNPPGLENPTLEPPKKKESYIRAGWAGLCRF
jgi:hypothetical protein